MADVAAHATFRALTVYGDVPAGCKVVMVLHDGFEPHLRVGEFAVVDTADKEPQIGEIFVLAINSLDGSVLRLVQIRKSPPGSIGVTGVMWRWALARPGLLTMGDGPYKREAWPEKFLGRVVGLFQTLRTKVDASVHLTRC